MANNIHFVISIKSCQSLFNFFHASIPFPQTFVFPIKYGVSINILFVSLVFLYIFYSFCALSAQKLLKYTVTKLNGRCTEEQPENLLLHSR